MYPVQVALSSFLSRSSFRRLTSAALATFAWVFGVGVTTGCAADGSRSRHASPVRTTSGEPSCKEVAMRLDSVGIRGEDQPHATYVFDLRVTNPAPGPRWLIFPDTFPREGREEPAPGRGSIDRILVDRVAGRGRVVAVHATGPGGFRAILLPGDAKALLNELPIFVDWTVSHATAKIEIILARDILVDDAPIASWVKGSLLGDADSDVNFGNDSIDRFELTRPLAAAGGHTLSIQEDCRTTTQAILKHREP